MSTVRLVAVMAVTILAISFAPCRAQDSLWSRTFGGQLNDVCTSILQVPSGDLLLNGYTYSYGAGAADFMTLRMSGNGDSVSLHTYGSYNDEICTSSALTWDGGCVLAGSRNYPDTTSDIWVVKASATGHDDWHKTDSLGELTTANSIFQLGNGSYLISGTAEVMLNPYSGVTTSLLVKLNDQGSEIWHSGSPSWMEGSQSAAACFALDNGFLRVGRFYDTGWIRKNTINGDTVWTQQYHVEGGDGFCSVQYSWDGEYIVAGTAGDPGDFWLTKIDHEGGVLWSRTYGGPDEEECCSLLKTSDRGYLLVGTTSSFGSGHKDFWIVKTDSLGDSLWSRTFGGHMDDVCLTAYQDFYGDFYFAGWTASFGHGDEDVWLVKFGTHRYPYAVDPTPELPTSAVIHSVYPNPFNPSAEITFDLSQPAHVSLSVFDVLGRQVATLMDDHAEAGSHSVIFDGSDLPSGVYICRLQTDTYSASRKMVLMK